MKRQSKNLPRLLEHRLNLYALAAGAAGVGMLALAQPAEAEIVYTRTHHVIRSNGSYYLDLSHNGITDFSLLNTFLTTSGGGYALYAKAAKGNGVWASIDNGSEVAVALRRGTRISAGRPFFQDPALLAEAIWFVASSRSYLFGNWVNVANRYLGLKFRIKGKNHYGWARLTVSVKGTSITATLTGYAYETIPNKAIIAGQTKGPDVITVQPASLGHLAAGASAIPSWRSRE